MKTYRFTMYFRGLDYMSEETAEALYAAGCDDCTPASSEGQAYAGFDREATSLETAIATAAADVRKAGLDVASVMLDDDQVAGLEPLRV